MISGVGTDLVDVERVSAILRDGAGARFLERVLTPAERELAENRKGRLAEFVAGRFAAKEAIAKALGCGIGRALGFQDMEVLPGESGQPVCRLSPAACERLGLPAGTRVHVSITHTDALAAAFAVAERPGGG